MTTLTKTDKIQLIDARMRNLEYRKYGLELDLLVENAKSSPSSESIEVIEASLSELSGQITALNAELDLVNAIVEQE